MELYEKLETYVGRKLDFNKEVILRADRDNNIFIDTWNVKDKQKPSISEVYKIKKKSIKLNKEDLLIKVRGKRDKLLDLLASKYPYYRYKKLDKDSKKIIDTYYKYLLDITEDVKKDKINNFNKINWKELPEL